MSYTFLTIMMKIYFLLLLISIQAHMTWAQNDILSFNFRYGVSTNQFKLLNPELATRYQHMFVQPMNDIGICLNYKRRIIKKINLYLMGGLDFSQSTHYQRIIEKNYKIHLDNILISKPRVDTKFGLSIEYPFFNKKLLLDAQAALVYRFFSREIKSYSQEFSSNNEDWIEYSYSLKTYHGKWYKNQLPKSYSGNFGFEFSGFLKFEIASNSYLNLGMTLNTRNVFFYDYQHSVRYYINGSSTPSESYKDLGFVDGSKFGSIDNYLYLNIGYSYQLKK
ncbi:hypothetical protein OAV92_00840 [Crocinitomicaceae bacterium]|jgi:hypothetical protein|nr:hypothetical protein [Crocinitomicaceae bacterium]